MNVYDSERMAEILSPHGYAPVSQAEDADLVILNTCHIREKAAEKVYSELGRLKQLKARNEDAQSAPMRVGVAGCVAQAEGAEIIKRAPIVDLVFGPQTYHRLPQMLERLSNGETGIVETELTVEEKFEMLEDGRATTKPTAFVTIQEGCDKFCTFCVVPYTRGAEYSRPVGKIVSEVEGLVAAGAREITLLGQNVNAYHGEGSSGEPEGLAVLCRQLSEIEGLKRIRYTTSHPRDMDDELVEAHRDHPKLMPYLHLPVQSGSDRILQAMNRQHTADHYRGLVDKVRTARPDIALSSDFIVGFPGETDEDFNATLELVQDIEYAQAYSFKYSPRPGTPGADLEDQIEEGVKSRRLATLQELLAKQVSAFNKACLGKTLPVLFEKPGRYPGQLVGRSPYLQSVHADGPERLLGAITDVTIQDVKSNSLSGTIIGGKHEDSAAAE